LPPDGAGLPVVEEVEPAQPASTATAAAGRSDSKRVGVMRLPLKVV
jgi:hypothetical protein